MAKKTAKKKAKRKPYSIRVGDKDVPYNQDDPFGAAMRAVKNKRSAITPSKKKKKTKRKKGK